MKRSRRPPQFWSSTLLFCLLVGSYGVISQAAQAQFKSPPGQGRPKGTAGGGSRPGQPFCLAKSEIGQKSDPPEALTAMAPVTTTGLTAQTNPTVWVYVPHTTAKTLEFSLFNQQREGIYQTNLPIDRSGLLKISLPASAVSLQSGQAYNWTVALVCDPVQRSNDWLVEGWIQHQALPADLQNQLSKATIEQRVRLYLQAGYWYEALDAYLTLRKQLPNHANLMLLWNDLLKSAGLPLIVPPS